MRGDTRSELLDIVADLEALQTALTNDAEYGVEKLTAAITTLNASAAEVPITNTKRNAS